ncbi:hypothetical protein HHK36_024305 [Tetracentron sinense]|uniref:COX assembly mitochondrial protein n=1 Tax=Tetracentron sinense TaxID=13715 RepID=A0A834YMK1_TETSI|nr:hypothetical protein HHK36_024305 [Tetracentron sinense]
MFRRYYLRYASPPIGYSSGNLQYYKNFICREVRVSCEVGFGFSMGYVQEARENHVKKKVEEALRSKMKQKALKECDWYTSKYAECAAGRTFSIIWQCRKQAKELNDCLHQ